MSRPSEASVPMVRVRGLRKTFRGHLGLGVTVALDGVSFEVQSGEVFGLLGPNGAGKTTTLKTLVGLLRPDRGEVEVLGGDPGDPRSRAGLGFLPENPYFYSYLTGPELLDLYARLRGIESRRRAEAVRRVWRRVGLEGREGLHLRKYSKGMLQRLGIAQALVGDPDLVILDEPMSGLDPLGRRQVRDLILELRSAGTTVLFSSHILQDAEAVCDRVGILAKGRLRNLGKLSDLLSRDILYYEVTLEGALPERHPGREVSATSGTCLVRVDTVDALAELLEAARRSGARVLSVWPYRRTLEDLFLDEVQAQGEARR